MATTRTRHRARSAAPRPSRPPQPAPRRLPKRPWPALAVVVGVPVLLWLTPILDAFTSVLFWMAVGAVALLVVDEARTAAEDDSPRRAALLAATAALVVVVITLFDPVAFDAYNGVKLFAVTVGGLGLAAGAIAGAAGAGRWWRSALTWPALALLGWTVVSTVASGAPELSILGADLSADGLLLLASVVALFFSVLAWADTDDAHALVRVLVIGAGGLAVLVGLLQLHDRIWGGSWDWGYAGREPSATIFSTFGNPNHFGGFLAMLLPLGVAVVLSERRPIVRWSAAAVTALSGVLAVAAAARGAWVATAAGLAVLVLLTPAVRRRLRATPVVLAGVAGLLLVGILFGSAVVSLRDQVVGIFDFDKVSTTSERLSYWGASLDLAAQEPLVGVGPDAFRFAYTAAQPEGYVETFGAEQIVNGPHNIFLNQLATTGVAGLLALLALVMVAALVGVGALRRLRRSDDPDADRDQILTAALLAALVAFVVQSLFNVQQVTTSFVFWFLLGLIAVVGRDAGVPATLDPRRLLDPTVVARESGKRRPPSVRTAEVIGAGVLGILAAASLWFASGPWRAERQYADALALQDEAAFHQGIGSPKATELIRESSRQLEAAIDSNPWRARYREIKTAGLQATAQSQLGLPDGQPDARQSLALARRTILEAIDLEPGNARLREGLGDIERVAVTAGEAGSGNAAVAAAYRASLELNPWVSRVRLKLASVLGEQGDGDEALAVLREGIRRLPKDSGVLRAAATLLDDRDDHDAADELWQRVLELDPNATDALAALAD